MKRVILASTRSHPRAFAAEVPLQEALEVLGVEAPILSWQETNPMQADRVLVRSTWDYTDQIKNFTEWHQSEAHRILNSHETFLWNYHKKYLLELSAASIPVVPTTIFKAHEQNYRRGLGSFLFKITADRFCLKPAISAGSQRTFLLSPDQVDAHLQHFSPGEDVLLQPFLETVGQDGELSLMWVHQGEPRFSHAIVKRPQAGDFRVQSQFGGTAEAVLPRAEHLDLCRKVLARVPGRWVFARVDLLDWQTDPLIAEVEMIEPDLFYALGPRAAALLAETVVASL